MSDLAASDEECWVTIDLNDKSRWGRIDPERMRRYDPNKDEERQRYKREFAGAGSSDEAA